jgi:hypothetical protein
MLVPVGLVAAAVGAGCDDGNRHTRAAPHAKAGAPTPAGAGTPRSLRKDSDFNLPRLGTFTVRCPIGGPYSIRFDVDPEHATEHLAVFVAGRRVRSVWRDPGEGLQVTVPVRTRVTASDRVTETPLVLWRIVQSTEPHTLSAIVRLKLVDAGDSPPPACGFERLETSLTTRSHVGP